MQISGLHALTAKDVGSIHSQGTKILQAMLCGQKWKRKEKKKEEEERKANKWNFAFYIN